MHARRQVRRSKGYVRLWVTFDWYVEHGGVLKNMLVLKTDHVRNRYLVEARKFRWPNK